ncbi:histidine phosphatase family protein [uncultured Friedmanniella sp.]|uniref:SixA phosphatase family protein n=1 Tax=uncultured Friedmanniella sp. TaxID=335381 RepID=UPI0035CAB77A
MTPPVQTLLLLRHATAEPSRPGGRDVDRPLSPSGHREAAGVGAFLRGAGLRVDHVLCSPAVRTRETLAQLSLEARPTGPVVELVPQLYQASAEELLALVGQVDPVGLDGAPTVLVVGHAPAVPEAVTMLAGPGSAPAASAALSSYPPAALAVLRYGPASPGPGAAELVGLRVPQGVGGQYFD